MILRAMPSSWTSSPSKTERRLMEIESQIKRSQKRLDVLCAWLHLKFGDDISFPETINPDADETIVETDAHKEETEIGSIEPENLVMVEVPIKSEQVSFSDSEGESVNFDSVAAVPVPATKDAGTSVDIAVGMNTIGLQVDLCDPDIYYFAGGRHVAIQTDETPGGEFEPIEFFEKTLQPTVIVRSMDAPDFPTHEHFIEPRSGKNDVDAEIEDPKSKTESKATTIPNVAQLSFTSNETNTAQKRGLEVSFIADVEKVQERQTEPKVEAVEAVVDREIPPAKTPRPTASKRRIIRKSIVALTIPRPVTAQIIQLKEKQMLKRREIGEDGWETVRPRSNRFKWSMSSRSSSSSNNDLAGGEPGPKALDPQWKEAEAESAADEKKIQEKEAALDSAILEEELIEQELLQMEKDFHQIENSASHSVVQRTEPSEVEASVSSPPPDSSEVLDVESELSFSIVEDNDNEKTPAAHTGIRDEKHEDDCFFVNISEESKTEDILVKESERILALREKLMSPAKTRDSAETLKRHQAKLAKAERNRERLLEAKYNRYVELSERFQTLNETTKRLVEERSELILRAEERRKRADEKRQQLIQDIKRKAHDEESKAKEIAFINLLETQIKRNGFMSSAHAKELEVGERLQSREEERKLKLEERLFKLSAVLERQSKIKRGWEAKLAQMQEKRRRTSERILREKQKREKERIELALEKAKGREERISAINAAKQAKKEELKKSIEQKQQDTARRHEENIEHIRQKAIELTVPRTSEDTSVRMCTICKVVIQSEVQELAHLRGRTHLDAVKKMDKGTSKSAPLTPVLSPHAAGGPENFGIKFITDVYLDKVEPGVATDKNRLKVLKKHCKKLLQKLTSSGKEFETNEKLADLNEKKWNDQTTSKNKIQRNVREMDRIINLFNSQRGTLQLATSLDRILADTKKAAVRSHFIQASLVGLGLFSVLQKIFDSKATDLPQRVKITACNVVLGATYGNLYNSIYVIRSSLICNILELSSRRWENLIPDGHRWLCMSPFGQKNEPLPVDPLIDTVIELLQTVLGVIPDPYDGITSSKQKFLTEAEIKVIHARALDIIGYIVGSGVVDRLSVYCSGVRGPVDDQQNVANFLKNSIDFLTTLVYTLQASWDPKKPETTQLLAAFESSEIAGTISMSYSIVLHQGAPIRPRVASAEAPTPPPPGVLTSCLVYSTFALINAYAKLDLISLQRVLGCEAVSIQFRHITSQLLWQVVPHTQTQRDLWSRLVNELIMAIGNFTVNNLQNQATIQAGQTPTVLQQLCSLPHMYFDDPKYTRYLFPTLIAVTFGCPENEEILSEQNIPMDLLHGFMNTEFAKMNPICKRLLQLKNSSNETPPLHTPSASMKSA